MQLLGWSLTTTAPWPSSGNNNMVNKMDTTFQIVKHKLPKILTVYIYWIAAGTSIQRIQESATEPPLEEWREDMEDSMPAESLWTILTLNLETFCSAFPFGFITKKSYIEV